MIDAPRVVSLFSGIEGLGRGLELAGMRVVEQVEIEPLCIRILTRHYPEVKRHADIQTYRGVCGSADVVCGGSPCQDISVAGKRAGLAGERSRLFHHFVRVVDEIAPEWLLFENVDGLLGSNEGADMAVVLGALTGWQPTVPEGGWRSSGVCTGPKRSVAWRVLDSQYFGLAQRRHRVFIVGHARADRAFTVLHEPQSSDRDNPPRHEATSEPADVAYDGVANTLGSNTGSIRTTDIEFRKSRRAADPDDDETWVPADTANTINTFDEGDVRATELVVFTPAYLNAERTRPSGAPSQVVPPLRTQDRSGDTAPHVFAFQPRIARNGRGAPSDVVPPLTAEAGTTSKGDAAPMVYDREFQVRRLTITERERVQGFPDGWTCLCGVVPYSSMTCTCPDGPRARAIGNAVSVPVPLWIGRRMLA